MIHRVTKENVEEIACFGRLFWDESGASNAFGAYNESYVKRVLFLGLGYDNIIGWINKTNLIEGLILFQKNTDFWSGQKCLNELVWYQRPECRSGTRAFRLYKQAEKYAKEKDFNFICMGRIHGTESYEKLPQFYEKNGFFPLEQNYVKKI